METKYKTLKIETKRVDDKGEFEAVFATLGVIDKDGDIIEKGAFDGNPPVAIVQSHQQSELPRGKGRIEERGDEAIIKGKLNLETTGGKELHSHLKFDIDNGPPIQEWSFGFVVKDDAEETRDGEQVRILKALEVQEVSPVLRGAGVDTRTLAVKAEKGGMTMDQQSEHILDQIDNFNGRIKTIRRIRREKQKRNELQEVRKDQMEAIIERLEEAKAGLEEQLKELDTNEKEKQNEPDPNELTPEEKALAETVARETGQPLPKKEV